MYRVKCLKCGDIIKSYFRHDFKYCSCENIFVDGGGDYLRYGCAGEPDSFKVIQGTKVTLEFFEGNILLPIQGDVENINDIINDHEGDNDIYNKPIKFNDLIEIVHDEKLKAWKFKIK